MLSGTLQNRYDPVKKMQEQALRGGHALPKASWYIAKVVPNLSPASAPFAMSSAMFFSSDLGLGNATCSCQWDNGKRDVSKSLKSTRTNNPVCFLSYTSAIAMNTCLGWPNGSRETCGAELNQPSCLSWDSPRSLNGQPKPSHVSEPSYHHQNHLTIPEAWAINAYYRIPLRFCWLFVSQHYCGNIEYIESVYRKTQVSGIGQA